MVLSPAMTKGPLDGGLVALVPHDAGADVIDMKAALQIFPIKTSELISIREYADRLIRGGKA